ncbi:MAG: tetratricopeptide repeat protein [Betaproteobacteria bacterium]|nr:tetratricopeptide repeat protein [Betaproteobacteria bacterium]
MADPRLAQAQARLAAGDAPGARALADAVATAAAVAVADRIAALALRSRAHEAMGSLAAAIADVEGALALAPNDARLHSELGILCADAGDTERAIAAFTQATRLDPRYARAWNNLGTSLRGAGRIADAEAAFARATQAEPGYVLAWANLGVARRDLGADEGAAAALERALALDPRQRLALAALAGLRRGQGRIDDATQLYERALAVDPRDANAWMLYAATLAERDDLSGAARAYAEARSRDRKLLRATIGARLTLPMVPASAAEIAQARAAYAQGLAALGTELPAQAAGLAPVQVVDELRWTNFLLAYHGEDDRPLQQAWGEVVGRTIDAVQPQWRAPLPRRHRGTRRIRVAFCSAFFREGTVGRYFERWITDLPRERFEVLVYHLQAGRDEVAQRLAARADAFRDCPRFRPAQVADAIRADAPDALVFPELGMDATTFAVAVLRLAPLQCAAWGHPVTTGLRTIDAFFTAGAMEPEGAQAHYTERLVALPGIGTRYARPVVPEGIAREALGLPAGVPLFLWPQSLFKLMPDDDALLARVLAAIPGARVAMFEGRHPALTGRYLARLDAACAAAGVARDERVIVLPQCRHDRYLQLNLACDAMLDTLRWSGGNTSLDAIACALPVVTLPGRFMRARQSAAMLRLAGVPELVARDVDDYIAIAARLATDRGWREAQSRRLAEGAARVFDDAAPVPAFADWLSANA